MDHTDFSVELVRQLRTGQQKYDYWLMAVAASSIAFALHTTAGSPLRYSQIPLRLAVIAWSVSFFAGCAVQNWVHASLHVNHGLLRIGAGLDPLAGQHPGKIAIGMGTMKSFLEENNTKTALWSKCQFRFLIAGAVCYVAWHVLGMWIVAVEATTQEQVASLVP